MGWRVLGATVVVLVASAITTTVFVRGQINQLAHALGSNKSLVLKSGTLAPAGFGGPETLLLIGNDQRKHTTTTPVLPHANEMLLVRIDPGRPWISMMSIPRELQVPIHTPSSGIVTTRLNAALFYGGINLVVSTIKQVTGLSVNHVVEIDFGNFVRAVNEIGCVYGMIDRRYYHVNVPGGPQYFQVNLQPGYQKLCGEQALQFVTYRHDDTSLERDARDQTFLLEVKQQYGPTLIDHISKFEQIFGQLVQTDPGLHTPNGVENLLGTLISSASLSVRQVKFHANLGAQTNCACVTATPQQIATSVHAFLYGGGLPPAKKSVATLATSVHKHTGAPPGSGIVPVPAPEIAAVRTEAQPLKLPVELPKIEVNNGYGLPLDFRSYSITAPGGQRYPIYVGVFSVGLLGQYYDVQGTTWQTAPLFDSPGDSITVAKRKYYIYFSGQHIAQVAWFTDHGAYWVRNTLTLGLTNAQMLQIAEHTAPIAGAAPGSVRADVVHQTAAPASVAVVSTGTSTMTTIGSIAGLLALASIFVGLVLLVVQRLRMRDLHRSAELAADRVLQLESELARFGPVGQGFGARPGMRVPTPGLVRASRRGPDGSRELDRETRGEGRTALRATLLVSTVGIAAALAVLELGGGRSPAATRVVHRPQLRATVAVLNAGAVGGAAAKLAHSLQRRGVDVLGAANLNSAPPTGYQVLYAPGSRGQAVLLARLLSADNPTIAPIDPAAQAAAGVRAKLAVVIP